MAPVINPYTSSQNRLPFASPPGRRPRSNSSIGDPVYTQHPDVNNHSGSQWIVAEGSEEYPGIQYASAHFETMAQFLPAVRPAPEVPTARLQAGQRPLGARSMQLAYLGHNFEQFMAEQMELALPDLDSNALGCGNYSDLYLPSFDGAELMQDPTAQMNTGYDYAGRTTQFEASFHPEGMQPYNAQYHWGLDNERALRGSISQSTHTPRTLTAGQYTGGMPISVGQHELLPTAFSLSPTLSVYTGLTAYSPPDTPLSAQSSSPSEKAGKGHIKVGELYRKWSTDHNAQLTEATLPLFKRYCEDHLERLGHKDVSRFFSKETKGIVGTDVSHADRRSKRHKKSTGAFTCPLSGCGAQCTRKNNLNYHLGSHVGLTDRYCEICGTYFSGSSIERHKKTCAGKKSQTSRKGYGSKAGRN